MNTVNKPLIVIVEDDKDQRADFVSELELAFPEVETRAISCGVEFLDAYEMRPARLPTLFVVDLMLDWRKGWIDSQRAMPSGSLDQAKTAMMCIEAVRRYSADVPIILWTMSDMKPKSDVLATGGIIFLEKDKNIERDIVNLIRRLLVARKP